MSQATSRTTSKLTTQGRTTGMQSDLRFPTIHTVEADGVRVFYREAGDADSPVICCCTAFRARLSCFAN